MVSAWPETKTYLLVTKRTALSLRSNCKDYEIGAHLNRRLFIFALLLIIILVIIPKKDRKKNISINQSTVTERSSYIFQEKF